MFLKLFIACIFSWVQVGYGEAKPSVLTELNPVVQKMKQATNWSSLIKEIENPQDQEAMSSYLLKNGLLQSTLPKMSQQGNDILFSVPEGEVRLTVKSFYAFQYSLNGYDLSYHPQMKMKDRLFYIEKVLKQDRASLKEVSVFGPKNPSFLFFVSFLNAENAFAKNNKWLLGGVVALAVLAAAVSLVWYWGGSQAQKANEVARNEVVDGNGMPAIQVQDLWEVSCPLAPVHVMSPGTSSTLATVISHTKDCNPQKIIFGVNPAQRMRVDPAQFNPENEAILISCEHESSKQYGAIGPINQIPDFKSQGGMIAHPVAGALLTGKAKVVVPLTTSPNSQSFDFKIDPQTLLSTRKAALNCCSGKPCPTGALKKEASREAPNPKGPKVLIPTGPAAN